ncbi:MAG: hypothetical protein ACRC0V_07565 [Fusobacteriaceae bacterium]
MYDELIEGFKDLRTRTEDEEKQRIYFAMEVTFEILKANIVIRPLEKLIIEPLEFITNFYNKIVLVSVPERTFSTRILYFFAPLVNLEPFRVNLN